MGLTIRKANDNMAGGRSDVQGGPASCRIECECFRMEARPVDTLTIVDGLSAISDPR